MCGRALDWLNIADITSLMQFNVMSRRQVLRPVKQLPTSDGYVLLRCFCKETLYIGNSEFINNIIIVYEINFTNYSNTSVVNIYKQSKSLITQFLMKKNKHKKHQVQF